MSRHLRQTRVKTIGASSEHILANPFESSEKLNANICKRSSGIAKTCRGLRWESTALDREEVVVLVDIVLRLLPYNVCGQFVDLNQTAGALMHMSRFDDLRGSRYVDELGLWRVESLRTVPPIRMNLRSSP